MLTTFLKILMCVALIWMCYVVITTQIATPLFEHWDFLGSIPWMKATLWDFYTNVFILALWVCYKEKNWLKAALWIIGLYCLGSIATTAYVLLQLFKVKKTDNVLAVIFTQQNN